MRSITVVMTEAQAIDVAEAISIRKAKLQELLSRDIGIDPQKIEHLSVASRCYDQAIAGGVKE